MKLIRHMLLPALVLSAGCGQQAGPPPTTMQVQQFYSLGVITNDAPLVVRTMWMRDPTPYSDPGLVIDPFIQPYLDVQHPPGIPKGDSAKPMDEQLDVMLTAHPEIQRGLALVYVPYWGYCEYKFGTNIVFNREEYLLSKGFAGQVFEANGFVLTAKADAFAKDLGYEGELNSFDRSVELEAVLKKHGFQRIVWVCSRNLQQMWQDGLPDDLRASHELRMKR